MFPETDAISNIISDTVRVVFKRRLIDRLLRLWTELARGQGFPRLDQIEPSKLGIDWANCLVIAVQSPVELFIFRCYWGKLIIRVLAQGKSGGRSPVTSAAGSLGTSLPNDRGPRDASRCRYPISECPLPAIRRRYCNRPCAGRGELPPATRKRRSGNAPRSDEMALSPGSMLSSPWR